MREYKFRGYAVEEMVNSQWIYGYGVTKINYTDGTSSVHLLTSSGDYRVEGESVGQYTGLKDKNGTKIYEGDIVNYFYDKLAVIKWRNGGFIIESESCWESFHDICAEIEVVGKIYENKTLLEEK